MGIAGIRDYLLEQYILFVKHIRIPIIDRLEEAVRSFSFIERVLFYIFVALLVISTATLLGKLNAHLLVAVPAHGGTIDEGMIGAPRFINPLLAASDADRDLSQLIYSGLMKATPEGNLIPDLAEGYVLSEDGLVYTFTIRDDARFHDGRRVTAEDVVYTITLAQDSAVKSPRRANWEGVLVEALDEQTVQFTLSNVYEPFLENTTMGILPKHIWSATPPEQLPFNNFNVAPIGSGPYKIKDFKRNDAGVPEFYELEAFDHYTLGKPYITTLVFHFYTTEEALVEALRDGDIAQAHSLPPTIADELAVEGYTINSFPLPRVFGVFFNQNQAPVLANIEVRKALDIAVPRERIVDEVLRGYGTPITGPLPPGLRPLTSFDLPKNPIAEARDVLERNGWTFDDEQGVYINGDDEALTFSLATANTEELRHAAELIRDAWRTMGADVELTFLDTGPLNNERIRPREYDALLFGQIIGRDLDPFPFWHSSQRNDPGLNIALYANITTDAILEEIRTTFDARVLDKLYQQFEEELHGDTPAAFVYTPDFIYVTDEDIDGIELGTVTTPAERFLNVHMWHKYTDTVWPFFTHTH